MAKGTKKTATAAPAVETKTAPKTAAKKETIREENTEEVKEAAAEQKEALAKKAEKAVSKEEMAVSVVFEFADKKVVAKELLANAKAAFTAAHKDVVMKDMQLYVNANDGFAYLVVNGVEYPEDKIEL